MTACGVAMPLTFFNSGISTLLGVGSASVLSRAIGKGDQKTVDKIMGNLIFLGDFVFQRSSQLEESFLHHTF